jgi:hypothetical protein|tara:strand:- start:9045 stop:9491 length:447 start_codon:yes stop_codon:yes gene_type:complete
MILTQLAGQLELISSNHSGTPSVLDAVADVQDTMASNRRIRGWGADWESCVDWSAADAGAVARARFNYSCQGWAEDLRKSLMRLSSSLRVADDWARAEVISSIADEAVTAVEQADQVVGEPLDWFKATPWYAYLGVAAAALLITRGLK